MRLAHGTLIVTIHCADGIVVCADSKLAGAEPSQTTQKLFGLGKRICCALLGAHVFRGTYSISDTVRKTAKRIQPHRNVEFEEVAHVISGSIYQAFQELERDHPKEHVYEQQFGKDAGLVMALILVGMVGKKRYYGETRLAHKAGQIQPYELDYQRQVIPEQKIQGPRDTIRELLDGTDERLASYRKNEIVRRVREFSGRQQNQSNLPALSLAEAKELGRTYLEATFEFANLFEPEAVALVGPPVQFVTIPKRGELSLELP